jgi:flagella basal body P-ring formation protein FlgA
MKGRKWPVVVLALAFIGVVQGQATPPYRGETVVVTLSDSAVVRGPILLVRDVATVQGGTPEQRQQMGGLDLAELPGAGPGLVLSRKQVALRLQLAGHDPGSFRIDGAESVSVSRPSQQLTETDLVMSARQHLMRQLPWPAEEVLVRLVQPVAVPPVSLKASDEVRLDPRGPLANRLLGVVCIEVGVEVNGQRQVNVPVRLEVRRFQAVAVVTRRINRGELLTEEKILKDWRASGTTEGYLPYAECAKGKKARRDLIPGQALTPTDVETASDVAPVLIKSHQQVKLQARVGVMLVTTVGEAMQDGRAGDIVQVRNVDSKRVVQGRVVAEGIVEVGR